MIPWLEQRRSSVFRDLKKIEQDEAELIVSSSFSYGGADFLAEWLVDPQLFVRSQGPDSPSTLSIVPQFIKHANATSLFTFALTVFRLLDHEPLTRSSLVTKTVTTAISSVDFFKPKPNPEPDYYYRRQSGLLKTVDPNLETFKTCLNYCFSVQCSGAIVLILEKAKWTTGMSAEYVQDRVKGVMLPLLPFIANLRSENPDVLPSQVVKDLTQTAIIVFFESVSSVEREVPEHVVRSLTKAAASIEGGIELIVTT